MRKNNNNKVLDSIGKNLYSSKLYTSPSDSIICTIQLHIVHRPEPGICILKLIRAALFLFFETQPVVRFIKYILSKNEQNAIILFI